jgi:hypothetical protein
VSIIQTAQEHKYKIKTAQKQKNQAPDKKYNSS